MGPVVVPALKTAAGGRAMAFFVTTNYGQPFTRLFESYEEAEPYFLAHKPWVINCGFTE